MLTQSRDLARVLRNYHSRSQSQSIEDADLALAEQALNIDNERGCFRPPRRVIARHWRPCRAYETRLTADPAGAQFYARADNLREWLSVVELRLGSLSQRLSASVGQVRVNTDLGGAPTGAATSEANGDVIVKTPWLEIDEVFYKGRGTAWAVLLFLRAAQFDFERTLEDKNAVVSLRQIIRELEEGLRPIRSPMILNGQASACSRTTRSCSRRTCRARIRPSPTAALVGAGLARMDWKIFLTVFGTVFFAELGDKTQLATVLFASKGGASLWTIFVAASAALVLTTAIGVAAGALVSQYVNPRYLSYAAGIGFIGIGAWTLYRRPADLPRRCTAAESPHLRWSRARHADGPWSIVRPVACLFDAMGVLFAPTTSRADPVHSFAGGEGDARVIESRREARPDRRGRFLA